MPLTIETAQGRLEISDAQLHAVADHARRRADRTGTILDATGSVPIEPARLGSEAARSVMGAIAPMG